MDIEPVDLEAAVRVFLHAAPGLTGKGNPVPNGFHLGGDYAEVRSPAAGAIGTLAVVAPRTTTDISDDGTIQLRVRATGGDRGAIAAAEAGCRAAATVLASLTGAPADVTLPSGARVRLLVSGDGSGPAFSGLWGGEASYTYSCTVRAQALH